MSARTFKATITVELDVDVLMTADIEHDREVAQLFVFDYVRGLMEKSRHAEEYGDPVRVSRFTSVRMERP